MSLDTALKSDFYANFDAPLGAHGTDAGRTSFDARSNSLNSVILNPPYSASDTYHITGPSLTVIQKYYNPWSTLQWQEILGSYGGETGVMCEDSAYFGASAPWSKWRSFVPFIIPAIPSTPTDVIFRFYMAQGTGPGCLPCNLEIRFHPSMNCPAQLTDYAGAESATPLVTLPPSASGNNVLHIDPSLIVSGATHTFSFMTTEERGGALPTNLVQYWTSDGRTPNFTLELYW